MAHLAREVQGGSLGHAMGLLIAGNKRQDLRLYDRNVSIAALTLASWALRPPSRKLGVRG